MAAEIRAVGDWRRSRLRVTPAASRASPTCERIGKVSRRHCPSCGHQVEPDPVETARQRGAETVGFDRRKKRVCSPCEALGDRYGVVERAARRQATERSPSFPIDPSPSHQPSFATAYFETVRFIRRQSETRKTVLHWPLVGVDLALNVLCAGRPWCLITLGRHW
jgi:hypothetical protein